MKRATKLKLALLGASALTLVACGEAEEEVLVYPSVNACISAGVHDAATCEVEFAKAKEVHEKSAPRYADSGNCNSDFGQNRCYRQQTSSGGSIWLPFMMGYMLAPRIGSNIYSQPLYRPRSDSGTFYTAGNGRVGNAMSDGRAKVAQSQTSQPRARTRTVSRGGFGARATSTSS
jgi:uncharacterized protein YgiB involved in biofilm formation